MNGRRARHIRHVAEVGCREHGVRDFGPHAYRPQEVRGARVVERYPETRLMPGPRETARQIRKIYTRTGRYPVLYT
jgi:hypothetical protein